MNYGYIRLSTEKQNAENQRFEIMRFCQESGIEINIWIEEQISGTKSPDKRNLGTLLNNISEGDLLISQRTKEALALRKEDGVVLGRPKGRETRVKLSGKEEQIQIMLEARMSYVKIVAEL